jgi:hypothetical protein
LCHNHIAFVGKFLWNIYLKDPDINPAPAHLFTQAQLGDSVGSNNLSLFKVGMRLEAKDRLNPSLICVATINDISNGQLLIHFDGWTDRYDYWCQPDTPDIHPIGWCDDNGVSLQIPHRYRGQFSWDNYLSEVAAERVPETAFVPEQL